MKKIVSPVYIERDDNSVKVKEGLTEDMSAGDLYKGVWRVSINFKTVEGTE